MSEEKPKSTWRKRSPPPPESVVRGSGVVASRTPPRANHIVHQVILPADTQWLAVEDFARLTAASIHPPEKGERSLSGSVTVEGQTIPAIVDPALNSGILRATCEAEYANHIEAAIRSGQLQALHPATHLPYRAGELQGRQLRNSVIAFAELKRWARSLGVAIEMESIQPAAKPSTLWPWGNHSTELLDHLRAAGERFWKNFDPTQPDTAPTNAVVVTWLVSREVPRRTAEVIATILRANTLPPGRPASRRKE